MANDNSHTSVGTVKMITVVIPHAQVTQVIIEAARKQWEAQRKASGIQPGAMWQIQTLPNGDMQIRFEAEDAESQTLKN
jgi:hypothetical protein